MKSTLYRSRPRGPGVAPVAEAGRKQVVTSGRKSRYDWGRQLGSMSFPPKAEVTGSNPVGRANDFK